MQTKDNNFYVVILAGGSGTRLWPMSRQNMPKQLHKLSSEKTLIQDTYDRVKDLTTKNNIFISLGTINVKETQKQLPAVSIKNYIIEPISKNTAPSIAYVTAKIFKNNPKAIIAVVCADHTVKNTKKFQQAFVQAKNFVSKNPEYLATIGIKPDHANTGYGYIKVGNKFTNENAYVGEKFVEKPNLETAQKYLASGKYLWNAGYFIFRADEMIKMMEKFAPEIYIGLKEILKTVGTNDEQKIVKTVFTKYPKIPIDTAIAEKVNKIAVIPMDVGWSDIGNWTALYDILQDKNDCNVCKGHHLGIGNKNCLFFAKDRLLATIGLEDIIIVDTPDVTLVCHKSKSQEVKSLIELIKKEGKEKYL